VDAVAASVLAAAAAWSATRLSLAALSAAGVAAFAWCCSLALLRAVSARGRFRLAAFDLAGVPAPPEELVLTDTDLLSAQPPERSPELLLDDVLAQLGPDSRVVRLFDPAAMPTPGELRARIDRHLDSSARPMPEADASQALHEALAELRRSLR
jgi:hypothetical protein